VIPSSYYPPKGNYIIGIHAHARYAPISLLNLAIIGSKKQWFRLEKQGFNYLFDVNGRI